MLKNINKFKSKRCFKFNNSAMNANKKTTMQIEKEIFPLISEINKITNTQLKFLTVITITLNSGGIVFLSQYGICKYSIPIIILSISLIIATFFFTISYAFLYTTSFNISHYLTKDVTFFEKLLSKLNIICIDYKFNAIINKSILQMITAHRYNYIAFIILATAFELAVIFSIKIFYNL